MQTVHNNFKGLSRQHFFGPNEEKMSYKELNKSFDDRMIINYNISPVSKINETFAHPRKPNPPANKVMQQCLCEMNLVHQYGGSNTPKMSRRMF